MEQESYVLSIPSTTTVRKALTPETVNVVKRGGDKEVMVTGGYCRDTGDGRGHSGGYGSGIEVAGTTTWSVLEEDYVHASCYNFLW